ncbi:MAG: cobalamin biosynthesis protein CbiG [Thermomicrobiales bacterium]
MTLFEAYIAVDWSAGAKPSSATPRRDAIWVGELVGGPRDACCATAVYHPSRAKCVDDVRARLHAHAAAGRRVFIGFDFAYGYPRGFADALGRPPEAAPWRWTWEELERVVVDGADNANNRFAVSAALNARCGDGGRGPFWGCPPSAETPTLTARMKGIFAYPYSVRAEAGLSRLRRSEDMLKGVKPVWQLLGAGSVGGQALVGIPAVLGLRDDPKLAEVNRVWPFETGFVERPSPKRGPFVLHAEIWPGVVNHRLDPAIGIRDKAQVLAFVAWLAEMDASGSLGRLFRGGGETSESENRSCLDEEGWILGSGADAESGSAGMMPKHSMTNDSPVGAPAAAADGA